MIHWSLLVSQLRDFFVAHDAHRYCTRHAVVMHLYTAGTSQQDWQRVPGGTSVEITDDGSLASVVIDPLLRFRRDLPHPRRLGTERFAEDVEQLGAGLLVVAVRDRYQQGGDLVD